MPVHSDDDSAHQEPCQFTLMMTVLTRSHASSLWWWQCSPGAMHPCQFIQIRCGLTAQKKVPAVCYSLRKLGENDLPLWSVWVLCIYSTRCCVHLQHSVLLGAFTALGVVCIYSTRCCCVHLHHLLLCAFTALGVVCIYSTRCCVHLQHPMLLCAFTSLAVVCIYSTQCCVHLQHSSCFPLEKDILGLLSNWQASDFLTDFENG